MKEEGGELTRELEAAIEARDKRGERYKRLRAYYYNDPAEAECHWPLIQPTLDTLSSAVVGVMMGSDPFFVAQTHDADAQKFLEKTLHYFMETGMYADALKRAAVIAGWSNTGWVTTYYDQDSCMFSFSAGEPFGTAVCPSWSVSLDECRMFGTVRNVRLSRIKELQAKGEYKDVPVLRDSEDRPASEASGDMGAGSQPVDTTAEDPKVEVWTLYRREDNGNLSEIILAPATKAVLKVSDFGYKTSPVSDHSFKAKSEIDGYYSPWAVAHDLQDLQRVASEFASAFVEGAKRAVYGVMFVDKGLDSADASPFESKAGMVVPVSGEPSKAVHVVYPPVNVDKLLSALPIFDAKAAVVARVSPMMSGNSDGGLDTATEARQAASGQALATDDYLQQFARGSSATCLHMQEVLAANFDAWFPKCKAVLGLSDELKDQYRAWLNSRVTWRPSAKSMGADPIHQAELLSQIASYAAMEGSGVNTRQIVTTAISLAERRGLSGADKIQDAESPVEIVEKAAEKLGLSPDSLALGVQFAAKHDEGTLQARMGSMGGVPVHDGVQEGNPAQAGQPPL